MQHYGSISNFLNFLDNGFLYFKGIVRNTSCTGWFARLRDKSNMASASSMQVKKLGKFCSTPAANRFVCASTANSIHYAASYKSWRNVLREIIFDPLTLRRECDSEDNILSDVEESNAYLKYQLASRQRQIEHCEGAR